MIAPSSNRVLVHRSILLDARLALFHTRQRWLALADLHFGYELSQRAAGNLFPLWGMQNIEERLVDLIRDYEPKQLVMLGDLVHDRAGADDFFALIRRLQRRCGVILICGNHDRRMQREESALRHLLTDCWRSGEFYFHHGDCDRPATGLIQVIGHHHPAAAVRDGAGLHLKLPAFVQQKNCWILPAFSPWAAGSDGFDADGDSKIWLCSPQRLFRLNGLH